MTIDQAISILSKSANQGMTTFNKEYKQALNMSINALQQIAHMRKLGIIPMPDDLEGETHIWRSPLTQAALLPEDVKTD